MPFPTQFLRGGGWRFLRQNCSLWTDHYPVLEYLLMLPQVLLQISSWPWHHRGLGRDKRGSTRELLFANGSSFILSPVSYCLLQFLSLLLPYIPLHFFVFSTPNVRHETVKLLPRNKLCPEFLYPQSLATWLVSPQ